MLKYRTIPTIKNDSLLKGTMKAVNFIFLVICESARWTMVFELRYIYKEFSQVVVNDGGLYGNP